MQYPKLLKPTDFEKIILPSGSTVLIPKTHPIFNAWNGSIIDDRYGNKPILCFRGKPAFAELIILRIMAENGWDGVWVDTFKRKYRTSYWPKKELQLALRQADILQSIFRLAGSKNGCWDVFCWKEDRYLFAEAKRHKADRIRDTQRKWLEAALEFGIPISSFLIVEWLDNKSQTEAI